MSFDVAVGVNQQQMNNCSQQLFTSVPSLFTGKGNSPNYPGINMTWQALQAPTFDLTLAAPAFNMHYPNLNVVLSMPDNEQTVFNLNNVTISCQLTVSGNNVQLSAKSASCDPLTDKLENFFAQNLVLPGVLASANTALNGLSIPPPNMPGVALSPLAASIQNGSLIAVANLQYKGTPAFPSGYAWPSGEFFSLLSSEALQAAVQHAVGNINPNGHSHAGTSLGGADFSYNVNIYVSGAYISGNNVIIDFSVSGNVHAKITVFYIPIGVDYDVQGSPTPEATAVLTPSGGNSMNVVVRGLNAFTFLLKPTGNIAEKILSAITWPITETVVSIVTPIASSSIHNVNFSSYALPAYSINVNGTELHFSPQIDSVANYQGWMGVFGSLSVG